MILDSHMAALIHTFFKCPMCAMQWYDGDKRYKKRVNGFPIRIYRTSETSVTLQCKRCKLKFMVTWRNFQKTLEKLAELQIDNKKIYKQWADYLDYVVDAKYSTRKPPKVEK